jgi:hypothetical protein
MGLHPSLYSPSLPEVGLAVGVSPRRKKATLEINIDSQLQLIVALPHKFQLSP